MSVQFSKHAILRIKQRFSQPDAMKSLLRIVAERLENNPFPRSTGSKEVIEGIVQFRPVRVVVEALGARRFLVVTVMWTEQR